MQNIYPDKEYRNAVSEFAQKSIDDKIKLKRTEFTITRKDGEQRHIEFSVYLISHKGKPTDFHIVQGEDITARKQLDEDLKKTELTLKKNKISL